MTLLLGTQPATHYNKYKINFIINNV